MFGSVFCVLHHCAGLDNAEDTAISVTLTKGVKKG